jgi:adenosine deaminase
MYQVGLVTTLNTDNTGVGGYTLTDEYVRAVTELGLGVKDVKQMVLNAARAAFLPPQRHERLIQIIVRDLRLSEEMASPPQDADAIPPSPGDAISARR